MLNSEVINDCKLIYNIIVLEKEGEKITFELNGTRFIRWRDAFRKLPSRLDYVYELAELFEESIIDIINVDQEIILTVMNFNGVVYNINIQNYSDSFKFKYKLLKTIQDNGHTLLSGYINSKEYILIDFNDGSGPHALSSCSYYSIRDYNNYNPNKVKVYDKFNNDEIRYNKIEYNLDNISGLRKTIDLNTIDLIKSNGNDVYTCRPDLLKYFLNEYDSIGLSLYSRDQIDFICPECGSIRKDSIYNIINRGFSCRVCGDGISYPEKVMASVLNQLNVDYKFHERPEWAKYVLNNKQKQGEYDFMLISHNIIIEMDGAYHYTGDIYNLGYDAKEVDYNKDILAKQNGYDVIRIDCYYKDMKSRFEYVYNSILYSLSSIFDLSNIDWRLAQQQAITSNLIKACNMWNDGVDVISIANQLNLCKQTIVTYLNQAANIGLCTYSVELSKLRKAKKVASRYYTWMKAINSNTHETIGVFYDTDNFIYNYNKINGYILSKKKIVWASKKPSRHVYAENGDVLQFQIISKDEYDTLIKNKYYINDIINCENSIILFRTSTLELYNTIGE